VSNRAIADRYLLVDEKQVRQQRDGRKNIPLAALFVLPLPLVEEIVGKLLDVRAPVRSPRRALGVVRDALVMLDAPVSADDRAEVLRGLRSARDHIIARLDRLAGDGR
jgi:hypothetical protein